MNINGIRNFINRRFIKLESFIDLKNGSSQLATHLKMPILVTDDVLLGAYRNGSDNSKTFFLSEKGVYCFCLKDWDFFAYQDISSADVENGKFENRDILILLENGRRIRLFVEGTRSLEGQGQTFYDIYDFLTFFKMCMQ